MSLHTVSVLVEDRPAVLAQISGLFARRGYNIHSLAVGQTEEPGVSRITVVVDVESSPLEQLIKQLNKMVHVIRIVELLPESSVQRRLVLVKVKADVGRRSQVVDLANIFRARILDTSPESILLQIVGDGQKVDAFLELLEPFGIRELVQTGVVAMVRGPRSMTDKAARRLTVRHSTA